MADADDRQAVQTLLGRAPQGAFKVVVRRPDGTPWVIRNEPLLDDGTPMPTRYWLVDPDDRRRIGRLEAAGGVRRAEAEVDASGGAPVERGNDVRELGRRTEVHTGDQHATAEPVGFVE